MRKIVVSVLVAAGLALGAGTAVADESDCREAARLVADRLDSGRSVFEDLTWKGAPAVVGECNDTLLQGYTGSGTRADIAAWLRATQV
jgi:hypothetical protein